MFCCVTLHSWLQILKSQGKRKEISTFWNCVMWSHLSNPKLGPKMFSLRRQQNITSHHCLVPDTFSLIAATLEECGCLSPFPAHLVSVLSFVICCQVLVLVWSGFIWLFSFRNISRKKEWFGQICRWAAAPSLWGFCDSAGHHTLCGFWSDLTLQATTHCVDSSDLTLWAPHSVWILQT